MTVRSVAALCVGLLLVAGPARATSVADFLKQADALKAKGPLAIFARSEISAMTEEIKNAASAYRQDVAKTKGGKGDPSVGCPPPKGKAKIGSEDLLNSFRSIAAERRATTSVKDGFYELMKSRYPCR